MIIGDYFYLSPAGDLWLEDPITASVPVDHPVGDGEELNLLYWDVGAQQWKHSAESCDKYPTKNANTLQVSVSVQFRDVCKYCLYVHIELIHNVLEPSLIVTKCCFKLISININTWFIY